MNTRNNVIVMPYGQYEGTPLSEMCPKYLIELHESRRLNKEKLTSKEQIIRDYIDNNLDTIMDNVEMNENYHDEDNADFFEQEH